MLRLFSRGPAVLALAMVAACSGDGGTSSSGENPAPVIVAMSPDTVLRGTAEATLAITGTNLTRQSVVRFNGADRPTDFVSATALRARLGPADLAAAAIGLVTVSTPAPGGGVSNPLPFVVANPVPEFTGLSVDTLEAGGPGVTVTVAGAKFVPESIVWGARGEWQVTYVSSTELRVALTADDLREPVPIVLYVSNPEPGGGSISSSAIAVVNPVPAITALSPAFVATGSAATVTLTGTGFSPSSLVRVGGDVRQATFVSATQMQVALTPVDLAASGTLELRVQNPAPGGGTSSAAMLELRAPVPVITSLLESTAAAGQTGFVLVVNGTGFVDNTEVRFNGATRPLQGRTDTQLQAALTAADLQTPGTYSVTVFNPAPGGGVSNALPFVVANPVPVLASISPTFVATGGPGAAITLRGSGFVPQSQVLAEESPRQTTYVSADELRVALTAADLAAAGDLRLRVRNPAPGGGNSEEAPLELHAPVPVVTSLSPGHVVDGQTTLTLRVNGTGFAANSEVRFDLSPRPTRQVSTTQLEATLGAADLQSAGIFPISVETPGPAGGISNALDFEVRAPVPTITSLDTAQTEAGQSSFVLRVNGSGFRIDSRVRLDGEERPGGYRSPTLLEAVLDARDLEAARSFTVTVATPEPGGGVSNAVQFHVVVAPAPRTAPRPGPRAHAGP